MAEIGRSQVWQWIRAGVVLDTGETVTEELVRRIIDEEVPDFLTLPACGLID